MIKKIKMLSKVNCFVMATVSGKNKGLERAERERKRERIADDRFGSENQTEKNELGEMGIEPTAFGISTPMLQGHGFNPHSGQHIFRSLIFTASWGL